jgi:hypothetical protein
MPKVESTRKAMAFAFNNVCAEENSKRLDELVELRAQARRMAGLEPFWGSRAD